MRGYAGPVVRFAFGLGVTIWMVVLGVTTVPRWAFVVVLGLWVGESFVARKWRLRWIGARLAQIPPGPAARRVLRGTVVKLNGQNREQP